MSDSGSEGEIKEGIKVFHESYGEGIIHKVFGKGASAAVAVDFKDVGMKILDPRMTKITL